MKDRNENIERVHERSFDIIIVGAGITGASIAREAAAQSLNVLLIDKGDFASGASSRSNQLLHSKTPEHQVQIKTKKQNSQEQELLRKYAPHLVKEIGVALPLLQNNTLFNLKTTAGVTLNEVFSASTGQGHPNALLNKQKLSNLVPALSVDLTSGGIQLPEFITDDSRFALALINDAERFGAKVINYAEACAVEISEDRKYALTIRDRYRGQDLKASTRVIVNATGAWALEFSKLLSSAGVEYANSFSKKRVTHVVVPASSFETNSGLLVPTKQGKHIYLLPWHHALLIGKVEADFEGSPENATCEASDLEYLLESINEFTKTDRLSKSDIRSIINGVSANIKLPCANNLSTTEDSAIFESEEGVFSVFSMRLDNAMKLASEVLVRISASAKLQLSNNKEASEMIGGWTSKEDFLASSSHIEAKARRVGIEPACIRHLLSNYGAQAIDIIDLVEKKESLKARIIPDYPPIMAEIPYAVVSEMAVSLQDVLLRRTRLAMLSKKLAMEAAPKVAELMASLLGWDQYRTQLEVQVLEEQIAAHPHEAKLAN